MTMLAHEAILKKLEWDAPEIYEEVKVMIDVIQDHRAWMIRPDSLIERVINAGLLVHRGNLIPPLNGLTADNLGTVKCCISQRDAGIWYHIHPTRSDVNRPGVGADFRFQESLACTCDDFAFRHNTMPSGQRVCKHILAYMIAKLVQDKIYNT